MKPEKQKSWQTCAAEIYITREILKKNFKNYEIRELLTGNWKIEYKTDTGDSIPNILKLWKNGKLQMFRIPQSCRKVAPELVNEIIENGRKNTNEDELKGSVKFIISDVEIKNGQTRYEYSDEFVDFVFPNDPDAPSIKEKMKNVILLVKAIYAQGEVEYEKLMGLDYEDEIWHLI